MDDLQMKRRKLGIVLLSRGSFNPRRLFALGEQGGWFDPSDTSTLFQDSAGTTRAVVDGPVGLIRDKSGRGNDLSQSTDASRPTLRQAGHRYYLEFDGTDDFLVSASVDFSATDASTVVAGVRKGSDAAAGSLMELSASSTGNTGAFGMLVPAGASASYRYNSNGGNTSVASITDAAYTAPHTAVLTGQSDVSADLCSLRVNGVERASPTTDQGLNSYGNYPIYVGRRGGTSLPFTGRLFGLLIVGRVVTAKELAAAEAWMNARTGAY